MFNAVSGYYFFICAGLNPVCFVLIYLLLPETNVRTMEAIDSLFKSRSPFNRETERSYRSYKENGQLRDEGGSDGQIFPVLES